MVNELEKILNNNEPQIYYIQLGISNYKLYNDKVNEYTNYELNQSKTKNKMTETDEKTNLNIPSFTFGQKAVGVSFNPSNDSAVDRIKQICANAIDEMNNLRNETSNGEVKRMCSVAITEFQTGQMWGVKAITWKD